MIETVEVKEFLRTGNFGGFREIHFGMKRQKLTELLGDSEWKHFARKKSKFPSIYKYGKVEFYFEETENGRLCGIQILPNFQEAELLNLKINYDFINSNLEFDSMIKYLKEASISFVKLDFESDDVQRLETEGGVQIIFSDGYLNKPMSLHKISKFVTLNSNQPKEKQISFSISETDYERLKSRATIERKSISNICKEIILNKLNKR